MDGDHTYSLPYHHLQMNRLGGVGLTALDRQRLSDRSFADLSHSISHAHVDNLRTQLTQFRSALLHFASTHRDTIKRDPAFRHAFTQMCANIGVDPLADNRASSSSSSGGGVGFSLGKGSAGGGGWWSEILGLGDWYLELAVQIVDICVSTRPRNGGLIEMSELVRLLGKLRSRSNSQGDGAVAAIAEEDVVRAIRTLKPLGAGYEVLQVPSSSVSSPGRRTLVRSVPRELDADQGIVLGIAASSEPIAGRVTESGLVRRTGWTRERARAALENMLVRDGLCWVDEQDEREGRAFWVVSVMRWDEEV